ncbi:TetR family transcriptional regulator [Alkalibaculum bacchi]|uniref:TetR family transcriptional regulator n=1 Tax=Alkalibaculum bacchi TaxID=645887 RepID=A0A366HYI9_9FIRM|nr:TetR/AcrR family transcriptional regulator [Alkalibaculum bacchi]RBP59094.1 TetR family transcriptional regulator [Alkalibaculum bacchi]
MQQKNRISRKEKAVQTKNKIYTSAEQLFNKHGIENVNVDDIVKQAGVAKGSFYVHFESKDALIVMLINDYVKKVDTDYKTYLESLPTDMLPREVFLSLVGKIADVITESIGYENMKILYRIQIGKDISDSAAINYGRELYKMFFKIIDSGISQRRFHSDLSADETAKHFVMAYRGVVYEWCVRYPEVNLKDLALRHFRILLAGIKGEDDGDTANLI